MGNFLAAPITEKETTRGGGNGITFAMSNMQGWRSSMEDAHVTAINPKGLPEGTAVFAVFDGHGGSLAAELASQKLTDVLSAKFKDAEVFKPNTTFDPERTGKAMRDAFMELDAEIKLNLFDKSGVETDQSGCTAVAALVTDTHIIVANAGDSRSVLAKNGATIEMSYDHKPVNPGERARIEKAGGVVRSNRVNGDLAVSRALGDFCYKDRGDLIAEQQKVSAEPDIKIHERRASDPSEEFLVIACDGVWDVMTNDELCAYVRKLLQNGEKDLGLVAEEILDFCLRAGSRDNMSVVLVKFPGAFVGEGEGVNGIREERKRQDKEAEEASKKAEAEQNSNPRGL